MKHTEPDYRQTQVHAEELASEYVDSVGVLVLVAANDIEGDPFTVSSARIPPDTLITCLEATLKELKTNLQIQKSTHHERRDDNGLPQN